MLPIASGRDVEMIFEGNTVERDGVGVQLIVADTTAGDRSCRRIDNEVVTRFIGVVAARDRAAARTRQRQRIGRISGDNHIRQWRCALPHRP